MSKAGLEKEEILRSCHVIRIEKTSDTKTVHYGFFLSFLLPYKENEIDGTLSLGKKGDETDREPRF
jgi:hypothetical protein